MPLEAHRSLLAGDRPIEKIPETKERLASLFCERNKDNLEALMNDLNFRSYLVEYSNFREEW
jgi:hypothetical protein